LALALVFLPLAGLAQNPPNSASGENAAAAPGAEKGTPAAAAKSAAPWRSRTQQPPEAPPAEPGKLFIELRYTVDGTMLQGNRDRSFLHSGINHTGEVNFLRSLDLGGGRRFEGLFIGRYTDNPRVDPERNSLQKAYAKLTGPTYEGLVGDALANYSRLVLNQNVKGLHLRKDFHPRLRGQATAGFFTDRWGSLYRDYTVFRDITLDCVTIPSPGVNPPGCVEDPPGSGQFGLNPASPAKPYSRLTSGARVEWKLGQGSWLAGNWSHGKDLQQSLPEARVFCDDTTTGFRTVRDILPGCLPGETLLPDANRPAVESTNNDVASAEANLDWKRPGINARAEFAHSWTAGGPPPAGASFGNFVCAALPAVTGASVLDARCFRGQVSDFAIRMEASQRWKKVRWRADYARFAPDFFSASARQVRDLQDFYARGDYELNPRVSLTGTWRRSSDNLNGLRNFTNVVQAPEIRAGLRDLPFYRPLLLQIGYRQRRLQTAGNPLATEFRDRTTYIPFLSADVPVRDLRFGFEYEHRKDSDRARPTLSADTDRYGFSFRGAWNWEGWDFSPELRFDLERLRKNTPDDPARSVTDPALIFPADFFNAYDSSRSIRAGFLVEAPKYVFVEAYYREFNSVVLLPIPASAQLDPLRRFFYLNPGFKRPNWRATITYKIKNDENRTVTLLYERSNNRFATGDPFVRDDKSFRETVIGATVLLRFGH
jgi:hypothetical protein